MNPLEFIDNPDLLGNSFKGDTRHAMRSIISGAFAIPMDESQAALFSDLSGGREPPTERVRELWAIAGRRSEKTKTAVAIGIYLATVGAVIEGLLDKLSPGERAVVAIIAVDRQQAKIALNYADGMVDESPILSQMIERRDSESIQFNNRVSIEVHTNSYRAVRGRTLLACILDECAFYRSDASALPDVETYRAALPGLATTGGLMLGISSPYSRKGLLYSKYAKHYGQDSDILVVKGSSRQFNPTIPEALIQEALQDDPEAAKSEWLGEFRSDLEQFVSRDVIDSLVRLSPLEIPCDSKYHYVGFVDPAGGGRDEFTMSIAHMEEDTAIVDMVCGQRGTPSVIVADYAITLKHYGIREIYGDRYGGSWPGDEFKKHGITYKTSEKPKTDLYRDALPMFNSGRVELPPDNRLINQLCALERRTSRGGRDSIDHPVNGNDDRANAVAGVCVHVKKPVIQIISKALRL